jgi:hypothetical protein
MQRFHVSVAGAMKFIVVMATGLAALLLASETWAGVIFMLTLAVLGTAILATFYRAGERRAFWAGFTLFGWGYTALILGSARDDLVTSSVLDGLKPYLTVPGYRAPDASSFAQRFLAPDQRTRMIYAKLEEPISTEFLNPTPLEDILKYIKNATTGPHDSGIPIYVDPRGIANAGETLQSTVTLDLEGIPLRTTLKLMLEQLGLTYFVRDGMLTITAPSLVPASVEPFQQIGHCYWALLAGLIGGMIGRRLCATRETARAREIIVPHPNPS